MRIPIFQIDVFAPRRFAGNPAAVCLLEHWLDDALLQSIAAENNYSETAFVVRQAAMEHLRWFTPTTEVRLCGHATLASGYVLLEMMDSDADEARFDTLSGELVVARDGERMLARLPSWRPQETTLDVDWPRLVGCAVSETWQAGEDLLLRAGSERDVIEARPDFKALAELDFRGIILTAPGTECDFVSRFFAPRVGVDEDPATGSAHCALTPYWTTRIGDRPLTARQLSLRGGELVCQEQDDQVALSGRCIPYLQGFIDVENPN